jgi:Fic family protein
VARIEFKDAAARLFIKQTNLYRQQERVDQTVMGLPIGRPFHLTEVIIRDLHAIATEDLLTNPGEYRNGHVALTNSNHVPPPPEQVPPMMGDLCDYVLKNWLQKDLVHLAAYVMWSINWIHPFENGNGRTSRATSYLVMCAKYGALLPAKNTVIQQIIKNKSPYYVALRACDKEFARTKDMGCLYPLEELITTMLKDQLIASLV